MKQRLACKGGRTEPLHTLYSLSHTTIQSFSKCNKHILLESQRMHYLFHLVIFLYLLRWWKVHLIRFDWKFQLYFVPFLIWHTLLLYNIWMFIFFNPFLQFCCNALLFNVIWQNIHKISGHTWLQEVELEISPANLAWGWLRVLTAWRIRKGLMSFFKYVREGS